MTGLDNDIQPSHPEPNPSQAELTELAGLREQFGSRWAICHVAQERGVRYMALAATLEVRPHTIITAHLSELKSELEHALQQRLAVLETGASRDRPWPSMTWSRRLLVGLARPGLGEDVPVGFSSP